jgi:ATP-dependent Zn protease
MDQKEENYIGELAGGLLGMGLSVLLKQQQAKKTQDTLEQLEQASKVSDVTFQNWLDHVNKEFAKHNGSENRQLVEQLRQFVNQTIQVQEKFTRLQFRYSSDPNTLVGIFAGWIQFVYLLSMVFFGGKPVRDSSEITKDRLELVQMDEISRAFDGLLAKTQ